MNIARIIPVLVIITLTTHVPVAACIGQNTIQHMRLDTLATEFASLSKIVELPLLTKDQKTSYLRFVHACASKQKQLAKEITSDDAAGQLESRLLAMELFVESMKKSYLKMQLLTVGLDESTSAFLAKSFDQRSYHQALATIHLRLYSWLEWTWKHALMMNPLSNQEITEIIKQVLPADLARS